MKWYQLAFSLFFFTFIGVIVVLMLAELPIISIIWTESGGTITKADFITFGSTLIFIIVLIVHLFAAMRGGQ